MSGLTRLLSTVQIVGSLLAVPVGLASAYSVYRANFSPETTCRTLRSNIIGMLDKSVDAATRRMLVRRDIAAFEQSCGAVDPDAHAAFKTLLAAEPKAAAVTVLPKTRAPAPAERKTDVKQEAKVELKPALKPEPDTVPRDASLSDARWLAAVRQALVAHGPERTGSIEQAREATVKPLRAEAPAASRAPVAPPQVLPSSWVAQPPAMPPPVYAAPARAPQVDADHPVPPAPIPTATATGEPASEEQGNGTRIGGWIAQIPLVGRVIERRGN